MARSFDDATPIYLQIAEEVRAQVLDGSLPEGARVTSTTEYATRYRINPATANKAIALLVAEGLVTKQRGIGMFVAEGARERLAAERRARYATEVLGPALDAGTVLGLDDEALLTAVADHLAARRPRPSSPETTAKAGAGAATSTDTTPIASATPATRRSSPAAKEHP